MKLTGLSLNRMAVVALLTACGGGDGSGDGDDGTAAGNGGSGVAAAKTLLSLTTAEGEKVCDFYAQKRKASFSSEVQYCAAWGARGAESSAECQAEQQDCLENDDYDFYVEDQPDCAGEQLEALFAFDIGGDCTATVGELEACINSDRSLLASFVKRASCSAPDTFDVYLFSKRTQACALMYEKCPRLEGAFASLL
jgi:hypothetical protein